VKEDIAHNEAMVSVPFKAIIDIDKAKADP
jgi:hypothetical protein